MPIKEAEAQAGLALTATVQAGAMTNGAAAQARMLPNTVALAGGLPNMASEPARRALRWRLPKQRLLRYYRPSTAKSEIQILVNRAF